MFKPPTVAHTVTQLTYFIRLVGVISEYNSYYANDYGWDPHSSCKSNFAAKGPADQCCGTFPTRFPFSTEGGARGCCGEKPYSLSALGGV